MQRGSVGIAHRQRGANAGVHASAQQHDRTRLFTRHFSPDNSRNSSRNFFTETYNPDLRELYFSDGRTTGIAALFLLNYRKTSVFKQGWGVSHALGRRLPDEFVNLQSQPDAQIVL